MVESSPQGRAQRQNLKEKIMNLNHVVISGWVVANIDSDNATERANAFRDACQKRSSYAKVDVAVENGFDGSKKILFMVTGDSDSLTDDINDLVESTITAGLNIQDHSVRGTFSVTDLRQVKMGTVPAMAVYGFDFDGKAEAVVEVSPNGRVSTEG
jgi:hypothetical protein